MNCETCQRELAVNSRHFYFYYPTDRAEDRRWICAFCYKDLAGRGGRVSYQLWQARGNPESKQKHKQVVAALKSKGKYWPRHKNESRREKLSTRDTKRSSR